MASSKSLQQTYPEEESEFSERSEQLSQVWNALKTKVREVKCMQQDVLFSQYTCLENSAAECCAAKMRVNELPLLYTCITFV